MSPAAKRNAVGHLVRCGYSKRRACRVASLSRSALRNRKGLRSERDKDVVDRMKAIRKKHPRYGCPRVHAELRRQGLLINIKRVL